MIGRFRCSFVVLALVLGACGEDGDPNSGTDTGLHVILVTWDGVRVKEFQGETDPELGTSRSIMKQFWNQFSNQGRLFGTNRDGAIMLTGNPQFMSLPGYQAITTGSPQACSGNHCGRVRTKTFVEKLVKTYQLPKLKVATISSWHGIANAVERHAETSFVNSGNLPLLDGTDDPELVELNRQQLADPPPWGGARKDKYTHLQAMRYLRKHEPRFMWIGFNDSDEWAHYGDYPKYIDTLNQFDQWFAELMQLIDQHPTYAGRTCVILTTDHGRGTGKDWQKHSNGLPSSGLVWMYAFCHGDEGQSFGPADGMGKLTTHLGIRPTIEELFGLKPRRCTLCAGSFADTISSQLHWKNRVWL
jgi:hypothetical protein